jgi:DNA-directed RNA polymerase subunit RPC12/RpoP
MSWNKEIKRPELWATPKVCSKCGWKNQPEDPLTEKDVKSPPKKCPKCSGRLLPVKAHCPSCGEAAPFVRIPKNFRQFMWGGNTCKKCGCEFDKWERKISD